MKIEMRDEDGRVLALAGRYNPENLTLTTVVGGEIEDFHGLDRYEAERIMKMVNRAYDSGREEVLDTLRAKYAPKGGEHVV